MDKLDVHTYVFLTQKHSWHIRFLETDIVCHQCMCVYTCVCLCVCLCVCVCVCVCVHTT